MKNTNKLFVELTSEEASMISGGSGFEAFVINKGQKFHYAVKKADRAVVRFFRRLF